MVYGNFSANISRFFILTFFTKLRWKKWEQNMGLETPWRENGSIFIWIYTKREFIMTFRHPNCLGLSGCFARWRKEKKKFKLFSRRSWSMSRGDWCCQTKRAVFAWDENKFHRKHVYRWETLCRWKLCMSFLCPQEIKSFSKKKQLRRRFFMTAKYLPTFSFMHMKSNDFSS